MHYDDPAQIAMGTARKLVRANNDTDSAKAILRLLSHTIACHAYEPDSQEWFRWAIELSAALAYLGDSVSEAIYGDTSEGWLHHFDFIRNSLDYFVNEPNYLMTTER